MVPAKKHGSKNLVSFQQKSKTVVANWYTGSNIYKRGRKNLVWFQQKRKMVVAKIGAGSSKKKKNLVLAKKTSPDLPALGAVPASPRSRCRAGSSAFTGRLQQKRQLVPASPSPWVAPAAPPSP